MKIYKLPQVKKAIFLDRPNRFLGIAKIGDLEEKIHVHDPGRLKELLYVGNEVLVTYVNSKNRKTKWDLLAARCKDEWIFVHSGYHREFSETILWKGLIKNLSPFEELIPEIKVPDGRLDFLGKINGENVWIEVKGCTLIKDNIGLFPDAPTKRGTKHINSLISYREKGDRAAILILIFSKNVASFAPNKDTDPLFYKEFYRAKNLGVEIYPVSLFLKGDYIYFNGLIPILEKR